MYGCNTYFIHDQQFLRIVGLDVWDLLLSMQYCKGSQLVPLRLVIQCVISTPQRRRSRTPIKGYTTLGAK